MSTQIFISSLSETCKPEFTKIANLINQGIIDGKDANSGTKKIISDIFTTSPGTVNVSKLKLAKNKINR